ncbi:2-succinyl-5-enolpyruvyl-6-hydroxy-3-cyclohexene-1-carboxylic-acid synthase [Oculatella sp. LEGE 06141]|uniref:2-succinyl-5-enolpyruvyl-6-hydroxy-3- cyclohexene-1-carboxylic-acid synthase n=1 Tax=Oculatella sp. LEGE 06141 TaxID=1828648 RepID=UPI00187EB869|nr:2-succinyl-5-enolpyruvyl-6-hydroxy-3-cyclohexene-1-carboxylic-acid synthase [Oculatella sp. LEGE 06141]MBE9181893.1 2-succinyl-5-enolpyruvyl-6-hydroxy-3-cyclohexene-1-carboxylic-acid synthase [Oculatella sp. LEGE 06141]
MPIDFRNTNTVWASVLVETLYRLGLTTAVICPGSRSAPLAIAFAQHPTVEAIPVLDERCAAFFALGLARQTRRPTALICTSGTAGANFYPAVIEARESRIPLLVLTADRPPELRECNAGQTVDQQKLYGSYPNWYSELAVPALDRALLAYLRQTLVHAWERSQYPVPGVVHLNLPFRDPLIPIPQPAAQAFAADFDLDHFFHPDIKQAEPRSAAVPDIAAFIARLKSHSPSGSPGDGIIIAGVAQPRSPREYCDAIAYLAKTLGFPVLAEGLSPVRNYVELNPYIITTYDPLLRHAETAERLAPKLLIRVGEMPTSKELRQWLTHTQPLQWIIDEGDRNLDPLSLKTVHWRLSIEQLAAALQSHLSHQDPPFLRPPISTAYLDDWLTVNATIRQRMDTQFHNTERLFEGKVVWMLSQCLPAQTPLFIANSTPVRDMEWFWQPGDRQIQPFVNRGANGIDGTLSTALGLAHRNQSSVLLTGDLALLHDTNGFLLRHHFQGHLTIVLMNNNGGGIFELLPIAQFDPPFEEYFATPQFIDFAQLCTTYGVEHIRIQSWQELAQRLNPLPVSGIRVLEIVSDRKIDAQMRLEILNEISSRDRQ